MGARVCLSHCSQWQQSALVASTPPASAGRFVEGFDDYMKSQSDEQQDNSVVRRSAGVLPLSQHIRHRTEAQAAEQQTLLDPESDGGVPH